MIAYFGYVLLCTFYQSILRSLWRIADCCAPRDAAAALNDRSPLVRWRAARIVGELGDDAAVCAALRQAAMEEGAFEVAFEMKDALRKVERRLRGEEEVGGSGPMWRKLQERPR